MQKVVPQNAIVIPDSAAKVYDGVIFDVYQWPQELYDGSTATFEMLKRPDTVWVICVDRDDIVLVQDEQPGRRSKLTLPGGRVEPDDQTPLDAAKRELLEEVGLTCSEWRLVDCVQPHTKIEWFVYTYLAYGSVGSTAVRHDAGEKIRTSKVSFRQLTRLVQQQTDDMQFLTGLLEGRESIRDMLGMPEFGGKRVDR